MGEKPKWFIDTFFEKCSPFFRGKILAETQMCDSDLPGLQFFDNMAIIH